MGKGKRAAGRATTTRPFLDACLIVKNEEANLPDCLTSLHRLRPLISSVCVYDTGSTDRTIEIARDGGCVVTEGYWDGDFARARNASLSMSQAEWALMIDADERVLAVPDRLRCVLLAATPYDVLNATFSHLDDSGRVIGDSTYEKVVRAQRVEYVGRVHETIRRTDGIAVRSANLAADDLHFLHLGYATSEIRRAKAERNASVSEVDVSEALASGDPQRIGQAHYHHARSLQRLGETAAALTALEAARLAFPAGSLGQARVAAVHVGLLLEQREWSTATSTVRAYLREAGAHHLARLLLARIAVASGRPDDAITALAAIPDDGQPAREVDPREVLRVRMAALDQMGWHDEALACCLILVTRWNDMSHVIDLLHRVAGQDADAVAAVIGGVQARPALVEELRRSGAFGADVAARL